MTIHERNQAGDFMFSFQFIGNQVNGAIPVSSVPAGSGNYVQNTTTQQASANFKIAGSGTAGETLSGNTVNATAQYNLGGQRLLSAPGSNLFAGVGAGTNTTGNTNTFFGTNAGHANTTGDANALFGGGAGHLNTTGWGNAFFGEAAGFSNTTGSQNTFFGRGAGYRNTTGSNSTFLGDFAGGNGFVGGWNTFVGQMADVDFTGATGNYNTLLGGRAWVVSGMSNATAIGYQAEVTQSNSLVLGSINGVNGASASVNVGIGTTAPAARLHLSGLMSGHFKKTVDSQQQNRRN
jgi:hypothetical protein